MENRFLEMDAFLSDVKGRRRNGRSHASSVNGLANASGFSVSKSTEWGRSLSAQNKVLVILIENGGVDLGIPELVNKIIDALPAAARLLPDSAKQTLVNFLREKIRSLTDTVAEGFELTVNRYRSASPDTFSSVVILRNGTASYNDLKNTLIQHSRDNKIIDLFILTHGGNDSISVTGNITGQKIRDIRTEFGRPLTIRSVYMMNCVGSSLNQAWIDAGAKVSSGAIRNNYLPEPGTFFFWSNWKAGQTFENAITGAYRRTISVMDGAVKAALRAVPFLSSFADSFTFENYDFVRDSAPVIQGQRTVTINSDDLTFTQSLTSSLATTVLPVSVLQSLHTAGAFANERRSTWALSQAGIDLIKQFEAFRANMYNDPVGHCTIGYGTLIHKGNCNGDASEQPYQGGVTEQRATELLLSRANEFQRTINDSVTVELNQNQYDALVSFTYNVGSGAFRDSTLLRELNRGNYSNVPNEMKKWTKGRVNGELVTLPGLVTRRDAEAALFSRAVSAAQSMSLDNYSRPFYDTGEHAILGQFINNAVSGPLASVAPLQPGTTYVINTVPFTYGQVITMGDFYNNYDDLLRASAAELTRLKTLIQRSENHYKNSILGIGSPAADVANSEWADPTTGIGPRFLDLAIVNNSHFAPPPAGTASARANNKQSWETYHQRAIQAARAGGAAALSTVYPINAFGDHFLTDAFSAGHLFNKEQVMNRFIAAVLSGGTVNSAGERLFEQVADGALAIPAVRAKLARWELTEAHVGVHLNLDTTFPVKVFYRVLKGVMEDTASGGNQKIANLSAKAVHDALNHYAGGLPVRNNKGTSWNLTGDGTLNIDNIRNIQLAVKQSVENIEDAVRNPSTPIATYFQRVWDFTPSLTDANTQRIINAIISQYTNPSSTLLVSKAIRLIEDEIDTLIQALQSAGKIRLA